MFLCVALKTIKIIVTAIIKRATGIQRGDKTHNQDHVIALVSLSTKNITNIPSGDKSPFLIRFVAIIYLIEYKYNKNF